MHFKTYCKNIEEAHKNGEIIACVIDRHISDMSMPSEITRHAQTYKKGYLSAKRSMYKNYLEEAKKLNAVSVYTYVIQNEKLGDYVSHHFFNSEGLEVAYLIEDMKIFSPLESPRIVCDEIKNNYVFRQDI